MQDRRPRNTAAGRETIWRSVGAYFAPELIVAALLFTVPGTVWAESTSGSYTRYTGNSKVGAKLVASGEMVQNPTLVRASADLVGYARLFGSTYEAVRVEGNSEVDNGVSSNAVRVKVAGYNVYSIDRSYGWSWDWSYSQTFFEKDKTIWLAGIPINCEIRVGGTIYANVNLGVAVAGAGVHGEFGSNAWGSATAGVDLALYRAGVRSDITLFDNWLEPSLTAGYTGITGKLDYVADPLTIYLRLVLDQARWRRSGWRLKRVWSEIASYTLTSWSAGSMRRNIFSF